jgi:hypothetical protein
VADPQAEVSPPPEPQPAPVAETIERFDPSKHTIAEVKAYIEEHPEERQRIMRRERAGKARRGLLGS